MRHVYQMNDRVQCALNGDVNNIIGGRIVGKATIENVIDFWIVDFDRTFEPEYPYTTVSVQHTFMRPFGSNKPFLCELRMFDYPDD